MIDNIPYLWSVRIQLSVWLTIFEPQVSLLLVWLCWLGLMLIQIGGGFVKIKIDIFVWRVFYKIIFNRNMEHCFGKVV